MNSIAISNLPAEFTSFEELKEDYPDLTVSDWKALAGGINIPVLKTRVDVPGRTARRFVQGITFDDLDAIERTYGPLREEQLRREEEAETARYLAEEAREAQAAADLQAAQIAAAKAEQEQIEAEQARQARVLAARREQEKELALNRKKGTPAPEGAISSLKLARELGIAQETLDSIAKKHGIKHKRYRFPIGPGGAGYDREQSDLLREIVGERLKKVAGDDVVSLASIFKKHGIGIEKLKAILEKLEIEPEEYFFGNGWGKGISTDQAEVVEDYIKKNIAKKAPRTVKSVYNWAQSLHMTPENLTALALGAGIKPRVFNFRGHPGEGLSKKEIETIREAYSPEKLEAVLPVSVRQAAVDRHIAPTTMKKLISEFGIEVKVYRFGNKSGLGITPQQLEEFDRQFAAREAMPAPDNVKSLRNLARTWKTTPKILLRLAEGAGVKPKKYSVRGVVTECLTEDEITKIKNAYDPELMKQVQPVLLSDYARTNRTNSRAIKKLAEAAGIDLKEYLFGGKMTLGITPPEIEQLEAAYEGLPRAPFSDESVFSLSDIADAEGVNWRTLKKLFKDADMEIPIYRFPNGRDYPGLRRSDVAEVKEFYRGLS